MVEIKKKEGESPTSHLHRFIKQVRQSGVLKEAKKRRFHQPAITKRQRRLSAIHRAKKNEEFKKAKKLGILQ